MNSYRFIVEKLSGGKTIWCRERKRYGQCKTRLYTINDQIIDTVGTHNHELTANTLEVVNRHFQMTAEAKSSSKSTHDIVASGVSCLSDQAIASLPDLHNMKRTIPRIRQKAQNSNVLPVSMETFTISVELTEAVVNRTFLQYDSGPKDKKLLIFFDKKAAENIGKITRYIC